MTRSLSALRLSSSSDMIELVREIMSPDKLCPPLGDALAVAIRLASQIYRIDNAELRTALMELFGWIESDPSLGDSALAARHVLDTCRRKLGMAH